MSMLSRRTMLGQCGVAAVGMAAAGWASRGLTALAASKASQLKLGLQIYSFRELPVDAALKHAQEIGFEQIEFFGGMLPINSTAEQIKVMRDKVSKLGMTISAHGVNPFTADAAANRKTFEFAKAVGIRCITADPSPDSFANLDELVKEFDIRVAIHNHGPAHRYNKALDVLHAIEKHDERIGACADLGHYIRSGEKATEVIRLLKGRLYGIHLKDFATMTKDAEGVILGKGHLDVAAVFAALLDVNFPADGALSLEYEMNPKNPVADVKECMAVAKKALATLG